MPAKVILEVLAGPKQGKVFEFDRHDTFLLGRRKDCHVPVGNDGLASRHHFLLEVNPPAARLRDLGSRNGTYVNGVKHGGRAIDEEFPEQAAGREYPQVDLQDGDLIVVGNMRIKLRVELPSLCSRCQAEIGTPDAQETLPLSDGLLCAACRRQPSPLSEPAEQGSLHDFELGEKLGQGGMGAVYRAVRKSDGMLVAVKVLLPGRAVNRLARERFLREIAITGQLVHPNLVQLLAHGSADGAFYFVMEHCSGGSLDGLMKLHGGKLPLALASPIMRQCLDGLEHAHQLRFIHRDLKPQNVLLAPQAGGWAAKIADFGLAKSLEQAGLSGMTATGGFGGTFPFMPREQLTQFKYFLPVSDLWSLAATFYNLLTGRHPLEFPPGRDALEVLLRDEPVPIRHRDSAIPERLAAVLDRGLLSSPKHRYQTAGEFKYELHRALSRAGH